MDGDLTSDISFIPNWIAGHERHASADARFGKLRPHDGARLYDVASSSTADVGEAIGAAAAVQAEWAELTPVKRGELLSALVRLMRRDAGSIASCVASETGKSLRDATGEVGGSISQGEYFAGEGMRLHGRSLTSGMPGKYAHTVRQPRGVAGLIVPANTPIANIAWKVFPALICGNAVVLKASEDAPRTAFIIAQLSKEAGLPNGVFNVIQGDGQAGAALVEDERTDIISFTGSTPVGRRIAETCGRRMARVSLELGGKNPLVVCDDAELDRAVHWAALSAFSNAGQRCAAGSRLLIFESVYTEFKNRLVERVQSLRLGVADDCDLGPVVSRRQQQSILEAIEVARSHGATILCGGGAPAGAHLSSGFYVQPTLIEGLAPDHAIARKELFGPVATLHPVRDLHHALEVANATEYGLTAAIHTRNVDRAMWFAHRVRAGVANVNLGTYGSEPHMPFGGFGASGNGTREPGIEALDVYSELKNIQFLTRSELI
jgi:alpha-ketoglutaric semialdehyde dehydrogenase